ncbi:hypothetical protein XENTR_v10005181 [Xenopus tropicalis]|nr:hypothetical protein XENTR_v10005181 [Xenopus tropicalis]
MESNWNQKVCLSILIYHIGRVNGNLLQDNATIQCNMLVALVFIKYSCCFVFLVPIQSSSTELFGLAWQVT